MSLFLAMIFFLLSHKFPWHHQWFACKLIHWITTMISCSWCIGCFQYPLGNFCHPVKCGKVGIFKRETGKKYGKIFLKMNHLSFDKPQEREKTWEEDSTWRDNKCADICNKKISSSTTYVASRYWKIAFSTFDDFNGLEIIISPLREMKMYHFHRCWRKSILQYYSYSTMLLQRSKKAKVYWD